MNDQFLDEQLPTVQGVTRAHLLTLPPPLRRVLNQMMQSEHHREMALSAFAQQLACSEAEAERVATLLEDKGYLASATYPDRIGRYYSIRYGQKRGRDLPLPLKQALQTLKALQLIEVKSDIGASTTGARHGADSLKLAAYQFNRRLFDHYPAITIESQQHLPELALLTPYAKGITAIYEVYQQIGQAVQAALVQNCLPVVISGDHSTAGGTIAGIKMADPGCRLGVVWIDAHADIHSPYTTPSGNMHGMPLATALAEDNLLLRRNDLDPTTLDYWTQIKQLGGICPKICYEDLIYVAVRDTEPEEDALLAQHHIRNFTPAEIRANGIRSVVQEIHQRLSGCDRIYISFDVDSMDPEKVSAATGTPVAGGLTDTEAGQLIAQLIQRGKVCCFEICEINPLLENNSSRMSHSAFTILESAAVRMTTN